ncbi:hypothetical protein ACUXDX_001692 [Staphylococcus epidermidis]
MTELLSIIGDFISAIVTSLLGKNKEKKNHKGDE